MLPDFTMPTPAKTQIVGTVVPKVKDQSLMDFNAPPEDVKDAHGDHVYKDHKGHYWAWVSSIPTWHPPVYPLTWGKWMMQVRQPNVHDMKTAVIQCIADRQDIAFQEAENLMDSINFDALHDGSGSWIVSCNETGRAVFETRCKKIVQAVNRKKYTVHTCIEWLSSLSKQNQPTP